MIRTDEIEALLNQITTRRLRFEHVVNELLDDGQLTKDEVVIRPERTSAYNFERDVLEVTDRPNDRHERLWQINVPRDGFYDTLPERLFHRAKKRTKDQDEWDEIRQQEEKQEQESRHFFLPFDNAFNHQRADMARFEARTLAGEDERLLGELLQLVAPQARTLPLTPVQQLTLFLIIGQAHQTVGNWAQTARQFSRFLQAPVDIRYEPLRATNPPAGKVAEGWQPTRLGNGRLGMDFVLPQPAASGQAGLIHLTIGPLTGAQLSEYIPGGIGLRYAELLAGYLFPAELDWRLTIRPDPANDGFRLSAADTGGRLGMTTTLTA